MPASMRLLFVRNYFVPILNPHYHSHCDCQYGVVFSLNGRIHYFFILLSFKSYFTHSLLNDNSYSMYWNILTVMLVQFIERSFNFLYDFLDCDYTSFIRRFFPRCTILQLEIVKGFDS